MKQLKFIAVSIFMLLGVYSMNAQQGKKFNKNHRQTERVQKHHQEKLHKKMHQELALTEEQTKSIEKIRAKRAEKIQNLREQIWDLKEEERKEIHATLTPEQKEKFEKFQEQNKEGMRRGNRNSIDKPQLQKRKMDKRRIHR